MGTKTDEAPRHRNRPRQRSTKPPSALPEVCAAAAGPERLRSQTRATRAPVRNARGAREARQRKALARLWKSYRDSQSDAARNRLVEIYQAHVREIVRRFACRLPRNVDRGDLDTAANFGLMAAIEDFDPARGVRFESYCETRVQGALLDELRTQDWLPRAWRARIELQKRTCERLRSEHGREPCDQDVAAAMEMPLDLYCQTFGSALPGAPQRSLAGVNVSHGLDVVPDPHADRIGEKLSRDELLRLVAQNSRCRSTASCT